MLRMRIMIANPFYAGPSLAGSARLWEMVTHFCRRHEVILVTSDMDYRTGRPYKPDQLRDFDQLRNVTLVVVPARIYGKNSVCRGLREALFAISLSKIIRDLEGSIDCAVISSPPIFNMYCVPVAKEHRIRTFLEVRDPWPDAIAAQGIRLPRILLDWLRSVERRGVENADCCVALTDGIADMLRLKTTAPVVTIPNMAQTILTGNEIEHDTIPMRAVFAGSIGVGNGFPHFFVKVFSRLKDNDQVSFAIYGDGPARLDVGHAITSMSNVQLMGSVPRNDMARALSQHQVAVMYTYPGLYSKIGLYNKFIDYLGAGLPVILAGEPDGIMASILTEYDAGIVVSNEDPGEMATILTQLSQDASRRRKWGANAIAAARALFSPEIVMERYERVVTGEYWRTHYCNGSHLS